MAVTTADYKRLVILQVGDNAAHELRDNIDLLWEMHADKALVSVPLRRAYTRLEAIDMMLRDERRSITIQQSDTIATVHSDRFKHLIQMRDRVLSEITSIESGSATGSAYAAAPSGGAITTVVPAAKPANWVIDANDGYYRGDIYRRRP